MRSLSGAWRCCHRSIANKNTRAHQPHKAAILPSRAAEDTGSTAGEPPQLGNLQNCSCHHNSQPLHLCCFDLPEPNPICTEPSLDQLQLPKIIFINPCFTSQVIEIPTALYPSGFPHRTPSAHPEQSNSPQTNIMADPPSPTPTAASPERAQVILMDDLDLMRSSATQTDTGAASGVGSEAVSGLVFESSSVVQSPLRPERGTGLAVSEADLTAYTNPESSADTTSTPKKEDKTTQTRIVLHGTLDCARRQHRPCGPEPEVHLFRLSLYRRSIHPIKMRLLMDGPNGQTIRYIEIDSSLCPDGFNGQTIRYIEYDRSLTPPSPYIYGPRDFVLRNPLPTQDWSHASLRPAADGHTVELYNVRTEPAAGLDPDKVWGARPKVEYTELRKVPLNVGRHAMYDDRLCVVRHPLFGRQNLVMKLAVAPEQVAALETEAQVYRDCVGHNLTPNL